MAEYKSSGFLAAARAFLNEPTGNPRGMCGAGLPLVRGQWNGGHRDSAFSDCRNVRDRWQTARIAELEAELAEARKPRWVAATVDGDWVYYCEVGNLCAYQEHDGLWSWYVARGGTASKIHIGYATLDEAKTAAEKAAGVDP